MEEKPLIWMGSSLDDLRGFPDEACHEAGHELDRVQKGLMPTDWKPMPSVGPGVNEIRVRTGTEHRVIYLARYVEGIYVLHAFAKKTRKTSERDIRLARARLKMISERRRSDPR